MALQCAFPAKILEMFLMVSRAVSTSFLTSAQASGCQGRAEREVEILLAKYYCPLTGGRLCGTLFVRVQTLFCTPAQRRARFPPRRCARRERRERGRERSRRGAHCAPPGEANDRTTDRPSAPGAQIFPTAVRRSPIFSPGATPRILAAQAATRAAAECLQAAAK